MTKTKAAKTRAAKKAIERPVEFISKQYNMEPKQLNIHYLTAYYEWINKWLQMYNEPSAIDLSRFYDMR